MTDMLRSVVKEGTGTRLANFPYPVAGKTGTTSDDKDVWWVGYTPHLAGVVWMGHDQPTTMSNVAGGYQPALMWKQIMAVAHEGLAKTQFTKPSGIVGPIAVCVDSGKLPGEFCAKDPRGSRIRNEYFIKGTEPTQTCDVHVEEFVDSSTGLLATQFCPEELVVRKVFIKRPPYSASPTGQIPLDAKYQPPTESCNVHTSAPVPPEENGSEETPPDSEDNNSSGGGLEGILPSRPTDKNGSGGKNGNNKNETEDTVQSPEKKN